MASARGLVCDSCGWKGTVIEGPTMEGIETWVEPGLCAGCSDVVPVPRSSWRASAVGGALEAVCPECAGPVTPWPEGFADPPGPCPRCGGRLGINFTMNVD